MSSNNDCQNRRQTIVALVLGELGASDTDELKKHIDSCQTCRSLYHAMAEEEEMIRSGFQAIGDKGQTMAENIIEQFDKQSHQQLSRGWAISRWPRPSSRTIKQIAKLAAAAVIIIAVLIGINHFGGSSVAWGNVINNVEQVQTFTCRMWTKMTSAVGKGTDQEAEIMVYDSSQHGSRIDTYLDGKVVSVIYSQPKQNACVMIIPEAKKYTRMSFTDEQYRQMQAKEKNPRELIKLFLAIEHRNLGRDTIDGVEVEGIEVDSPKVGGGMFESATGRLWVDVETELPILMEVEGVSAGGKTKIVMDEFQWDVELEPAMFEPNIPADYTLLAEVRMPSSDEGQMIKGLRLFAEISGGRYPSSLASMTVQEEFRNVLEQNYSGEPPCEVIEKSMCINSIGAFYTKLLEENKELEYYGDKVTAEDMDTELMRWQIAEGEYRVIYGDLRTENVVDKEMLLDMALKISGEKLPPHKRGKVLRMLSLNEKDLIRGLGVWLELLDGKYPNRLEPKAAIRQSEPLLIAKYYDAKQVIKGKEKELEEKTYDLFFASAFYDKLVREKKDVAYYGDKIMIEDSDKVLVRWKISDNQYRIVFGNLTRKTVTTKELAKLEKLALE